MREWVETKIGEDGLKYPCFYSAPEDMPLEVLRRFETAHGGCLALTKRGTPCQGGTLSTRGIHHITLCRTHARLQPHLLFAVEWHPTMLACPCGCGYQVNGWATYFEHLSPDIVDSIPLQR